MTDDPPKQAKKPRVEPPGPHFGVNRAMPEESPSPRAPRIDPPGPHDAFSYEAMPRSLEGDAGPKQGRKRKPADR